MRHLLRGRVPAVAGNRGGGSRAWREREARGVRGGAGHVPGPEAVVPRRRWTRRGGVLAKCWREPALDRKRLEGVEGACAR